MHYVYFAIVFAVLAVVMSMAYSCQRYRRRQLRMAVARNYSGPFPQQDGNMVPPSAEAYQAYRGGPPTTGMHGVNPQGMGNGQGFPPGTGPVFGGSGVAYGVPIEQPPEIRGGGGSGVGDIYSASGGYGGGSYYQPPTSDNMGKPCKPDPEDACGRGPST